MNKALDIQRYTPEQQTAWDELVNHSSAPTFLFLRDYMEYHADRFDDYSLMIYEGNKLLALLPASRHNNEVVSHGGLTYGGFVTTMAITSQRLLEIFETVAQHMRGEGITAWHYKPMPHIYHQFPQEAELYALFRMGAVRTACNLSSAISLSTPVRYAELRRRGIKRAQQNGIVITESNHDYGPFWDILTQCLHDRHGVTPVHTLAEISMLHSRFPRNIRLYTATKDGRVVAGCVMYYTGTVAHAQYISASPEGRECGALDLLFSHLIEREYQGYLYFDFGISTEEGGHILNTGLLSQKEGFGARGVIYESYRIDL